MFTTLQGTDGKLMIITLQNADSKRIFYEINEIILITSLVIIWYKHMSYNTITVTYIILSVDISLSNFN